MSACLLQESVHFVITEWDVHLTIHFYIYIYVLDMYVKYKKCRKVHAHIHRCIDVHMRSDMYVCVYTYIHTNIHMQKTKKSQIKDQDYHTAQFTEENSDYCLSFRISTPWSWTWTNFITLYDCWGKYCSIRIAFQKHQISLNLFSRSLS